MSDKTARERFVEAFAHLSGARKFLEQAADAFADQECDTPTISPCEERASHLHADEFGVWTDEEEATEHSKCRAALRAEIRRNGDVEETPGWPTMTEPKTKLQEAHEAISAVCRMDGTNACDWPKDDGTCLDAHAALDAAVAEAREHSFERCRTREAHLEGQLATERARADALEEVFTGWTDAEKSLNEGIAALRGELDEEEVAHLTQAAVKVIHDKRTLEQSLAERTRERDKFKAAEKELSDAYLAIRKEVGAWDTKPGGIDRFEVTLAAVQKLKRERDEARAALDDLRKRVADWNAAVETIIGRVPEPFKDIHGEEPTNG